MKYIVVVLVYHLGAFSDRVVFPADNCINSGAYAQQMVAQTSLVGHGDEIFITCKAIGTMNG
jgi:hypothetical protein